MNVKPVNANTDSPENKDHLPDINTGNKMVFTRQMPPWHRTAKSDSLYTIQQPRRTKTEIYADKWSHTPARVGSMQNRHHISAGGNVFIKFRKCKWNATAKVNSFENWDRTPAGGTGVKIFNERPTWHAEAKIASRHRANEKPMQKRDVRIVNKLPHWRQKSKVGSLDKVKYMQDVLAGRVPIYDTQPNTEQVLPNCAQASDVQPQGRPLNRDADCSMGQ